MTSKADRLYQEAIDRMTGMERVQRTCLLCDEFVEMLRHRIRLENPGLDEREVGLRAAEHMYADDPAAMRLIARVRADGTK